MYVCIYVGMYMYLYNYSQTYDVLPEICFTCVFNAEVRHGKPRALVIVVRTVATRQRHFLQPFGLNPIIFCVWLVLCLFPLMLCLQSGGFPSQHVHENRRSGHLPLSKKMWAIGLHQQHVVCLPCARATHISFVHVIHGWSAMPFQQIQ